MKYLSHTLVGLLLVVAVLCSAGCSSTPPPDEANTGQLASIKITGHSEIEVLRALKAVFSENGYQHVDGLTFDKRGSTWDTAAYGGWTLGGVWIRVKATVDPAPDGDGGFVVGCDAYRVTDHNSGVMEVEHKMTHSYRSEFQHLLQTIKQRVDSSPPQS